MKFFLDTAKIEEIRAAVSTGMIDGVTTNPSLLMQTGLSAAEVYKEICKIVEGPVSAEVYATDTEGMVKEGQQLAMIADNIVVKIPMTEAGIKAVQILRADDIPCNVTLVFSPTQALLAAKAGAVFVSPFIGRLDDASETGIELVSQIMEIYAHYDFETEVIVASIRHPVHVVESALLGADIATMPYGVFQKLFKHPLTDIGIQKFLSDAGKIPR